MLPVNFTRMVSLHIRFLVDFSITTRSLHPIGNIMAPGASLYRNNIFCIGDCLRSLEFLYFSIQCKYWVLYLEFPREFKFILNIVILYFCLIHEILVFQVNCSIILLVLQDLNVACKCSIIQTKIIIVCEELRQDVSRILPTWTKISSNQTDLFNKTGYVASKWRH